MKANPRFVNKPTSFWAHVRSISQQLGYTDRKTSQIRIPSIASIATALEELGLGNRHLVSQTGRPTALGRELIGYFEHRANVLNNEVEARLMNAEQAARMFHEVQERTGSQLPVSMNKQKGEKKKPAYLTGIVNMIVEDNLDGEPCDFSPRELTTFTRDDVPIQTLARWVDGAFPSAVNPIAIWEIKEYYHTTTFGSRVADGVYETLLDGMELQLLRQERGIDCAHYLMIDAHYTWWTCGRSYLCRIVDMLHMGYVDEVLVGREVVERLPEIVQEWVRQARSQ